MELLQMSQENTTVPAVRSTLDKSFIIGGKSVPETGKIKSEPIAPLPSPASLSPLINLNTYSRVLAYAKYRSKCSVTSSVDKRHSQKRPAIVIPCHTNTVCPYCQLYDDEHECQDEEKTTTLEKSEKSKDNIAKQSLLPKEPSHENANLVKQFVQLKLNDKPEIELSENNSRESQNLGKDILEKNKPYKNHTDYRQSCKLNTINAHRRTADVLPEVLPKVYKLRYTKSSVSSMRAGPPTAIDTSAAAVPLF